MWCDWIVKQLKCGFINVVHAKITCKKSDKKMQYILSEPQHLMIGTNWNWISQGIHKGTEFLSCEMWVGVLNR